MFLMKKNLLITVFAAAGIMSAASVLAADGQINFVGTITDTSCTVTNNPGNPLTVTLGTVVKMHLPAPAQPQRRLSLQLS